MTMHETTEAHDPSGWIGHTMVDSSDDKVGKIADIYADDKTGAPEWLAVKTGLLGNRLHFVPLAGATADGDDLQVRFEKEQVTGSPTAEEKGHLSLAEEAALYRHYGLAYDDATTDGLAGGRLETESTDTSSPNTDTAMTRSEEELRVGTRTTEAGRARLRKYVVTENQQVTVPVQREEVRVEREPITADNRNTAMDAPAIGEAEAEVVLHEEQVVVDTTVVPKERVRVEKDVVTEQRTVDADVRKEVIETDGDVRDSPR